MRSERRRRRRRRALALTAAAVAAIAVIGAGLYVLLGGTDDSSTPAADRDTTSTSSSSTTRRPAVTTTTLPGVQVAGVQSTRLDDLHGRTVCEFDVVHQVNAVVVADVYTTATVADCDEAAFAAVDTKALAQAKGVPLVLRNGPRVWVLDSLSTAVASDGATLDAGGITLGKSATVELDSVSSQQPYAGYTLQRDAVVVYDAGRRVYELHDAKGNTWVMQSFSTRVDPTTTTANLAKLGSRLHLPKGWTFSSRVLDDELRIQAPNRRMRVLQDDFSNSYVRAS